MDQGLIEPGDCLVAHPMCKDSRFARSVIMLWSVSELGAQGLVLNRRSTHTLGEITNNIDLGWVGEEDINWGGPVNNNLVLMLHTPEWSTERTRRVNSEVSVTSDSRMFEFMSQGQSPQLWRCMFGLATWTPGQLDQELEGHLGPNWMLIKQPPVEWTLAHNQEGLWTNAVEAVTQQAVDKWLA